MAATEKININSDLSLLLWKNSLGLNIHDKVIYFSNITIKALKVESNIFEVLPAMLKTAYDSGAYDAKVRISNKHKEFINSLR